jgi:hypothetical protein
MKLIDDTGRPAIHDRDRIDSFLSALREFKTRLSAIESEHPFLRNDFSSACDEAISRLSSPVSLPENISPYPCGEPEDGFTFDERELYDSIVKENALEPRANQQHPNPVVVALDRTGGYLVLGLDKMGDGIITVFESLLKLGNPGRKGGNSKSGQVRGR